VLFLTRYATCYNAILRHVRVIIFSIPMQQCVPLCYCCLHNVAVSNIKPFSVAMEKQQWVPFLLSSRCKIFRTAANSINVLRSSRKAPDILVRFEPHLEFLDRPSSKSPILNLTKICPVGTALINEDRVSDGQTLRS
jgi:hypothetical protein